MQEGPDPRDVIGQADDHVMVSAIFLFSFFFLSLFLSFFLCIYIYVCSNITLITPVTLITRITLITLRHTAFVHAYPPTPITKSLSLSQTITTPVISSW